MTTPSLPIVEPRVDILENDAELLLIADLPGVTREGLRLSIEASRLTIEAESSHQAAGRYQHREFGQVRYRRLFSLRRPIEVDQVKAELKEGVLTVHLPRKEQSGRRIEVLEA